MGEVGVDPELVARAATALEQLRDALAAHVPTIVTGMSEYNSTVNTAVLMQAQARSVHDAEDMRARARLAQLWEAQGVNLVGQGLVDIPWSGGDLDTADAQAEAFALAQAESGKDPKVSAATISAIQADLQDHLNDPAWLQVFYNNAGPAVAKLASTLHAGDVNPNDPNSKFTVLTKSDQQILATFAQGLASADSAGSLSPDTIQAIAHSPDLWSASMLVKYGPPGSSWATGETKSAQNPDGLSLLAVLTTSVYQGIQNGTVRIPLGGGYSRYGMEDQQKLQDTLEDYDPLQAMLAADAQNKSAAQQVMGDSNPAYGNIGPSLAKLLLWNNGDLPGLDARFVEGAPNDRGQYPGYFTASPPGKSVTEDYSDIGLNFLSPSVSGAFLDAATSAPRGDSTAARYSAQAALNIIDNTPNPNGDDGVKLDPALQQALTNTAQRYLLDLGGSANSAYPSQIIAPGPGSLPAWSLHIQGQGKDNALSNFLEQIASNKTDLATINAATKTMFGNYYAQIQLQKLPASLKGAQPDDAMVRLLGRIDTAANNDGISLATDLDEQHEEYNKMLEFAEDSAKFVPVVGEAADEYLDPAKDALGLLGVPTEFSTDNAAGAQQVDTQNFAVGSTQLHITMVQGLINNGAPDITSLARRANATLPPDQRWLVNGQIVLNNSNGAQFDAWYTDQVAGLHQLDKLEGNYSWLYYQQGATASGGPGPW